MRGNEDGRLIKSFSKVASLAEVFECLVENASDAMADGGKLTIENTKTNVNLQISFTATETGIPNQFLRKRGNRPLQQRQKEWV